MPREPPQLVTSQGELATGQVLDVPADGLTLTLKVPEVAPAHLELTKAELTLEASKENTTLDGGKAGLVVVTNLGTLSEGWADDKVKDVTWLTADWGSRRFLASIQVSSTDAQEPNNARLKVSDGGVWFPPLPTETVPFNRKQTLPDIVASKLMIEVVEPQAGGVLKPSSSHLSGLTLELAGQPFDLSVRVAGQPPVFVRPGRLLPGQGVSVGAGLREALQQRIPRDGKAVDVPIVLQAALPGTVTVKSAEFAAQAVYTALEGGDASLPLSWRGEPVGGVIVGEGTTLTELGFTLVPELLPERILLEGLPESASPAYAQLCDPTHEAAQGFLGLGTTALAGADVLLRPMAKQVAGVLSLHPDARGRPGDVAYAGAQMPFIVSVTDAAPREPRWVSLQLPEPVLLKEPWWLVLSVSEGEVLWPLCTEVSARGDLRAPVLERLEAGTWSPWEEPPSQPIWAMSRLRVASQDPAPSFQVAVWRGAATPQWLELDPSGRVAMSPDMLGKLGTEGDTVWVAVRSAKVPVRGVVRFDDLRVAVSLPPPRP